MCSTFLNEFGSTWQSTYGTIVEQDVILWVVLQCEQVHSTTFIRRLGPPLECVQYIVSSKVPVNLLFEIIISSNILAEAWETYGGYLLAPHVLVDCNTTHTVPLDSGAIWTARYPGLGPRLEAVS